MNTAYRYNTGLALVGCSVLLVSAAQLLLKFAMLRTHGVSDFIAQSSAIDLIGLLALCAGLCCYGLSFLIWQRALGNLPLSFAFPLLSLSYPLVYAATLLLPAFGDTLNPARVVGICFIVIGAVLLAPAKNIE